MAWYLLGALSISTSKILLLNNVPPLYLTLQQLSIGALSLRGLLKMKAFGSAGIFSMKQSRSESASMDSRSMLNLNFAGLFFGLGWYNL